MRALLASIAQKSRRRTPAAAATAVAVIVASCAAMRVAHSTESVQRLDPITVVATGTANMAAASAGDVSQEQMLSEPLLRPAAVLEKVPGLIVTQHSGEGKANQYFLRALGW